MGKALSRTIKGMGFKARLLLIAGCTALATLVMLQGWYGMGSLDAAIGTNSWTTLYNSASYPNAATATYSVPSGSNRLLVVAVSSARSAVGTQSYSISYGGRALTRVAGDETSATPRQHSALYYLNEAGIAAATGTTFTMTVSGGTSTYTHIMATTYTGVNQSAPVTASRNYNSGTGTTATPTFASALTEAAGDQPVVIMNSLRTASTTARTITAGTNWSIPTGANLSGANTDALRSTGLIRTSPASATSDSTAGTISTASLASMTGMSLAAAPASTTLTVSGNTPIASGTRLDSDNGVLMQRLTATASGALQLSSLTLDDTGTATSIDEADVYISPTSATTLPADAVLIGKAAFWGGGSSTVTLDQGTAANRTLGGTEPTTKYLYLTYDMTAGQATKTVQSKVTAVGVASPNVGASGLSYSSNVVTLDYSGNQATVIGNTAVATQAKDSDVGVLMQHFQVDCSTGFDGALELSSLSMRDLGDVLAVGGVKIYVDQVEQPTLPASAKLIGAISDWNRSPVTIPLVDDFGATSADRTVVAGTHKYLYVVYAMNYVDDALWPSTGKVVQSQVTAVGAASPDAGASGLALNSNSITLTRGTWSKITSCGGCHDVSGMTDSAARNVPSGDFPGSHYRHANVGGFDCSQCHIKPTVYNHANNKIDMAPAIRSAGGTTTGTYSRGTGFTVSNSATTNFGYCSNVDCHSNGAGGTKQAGDTRTLGMGNTQNWGTAGTCSGCHQMPPNYANGATTWGAAKANSHPAHANVLCSTCHSSVTTADGGATYTTGTGHADGYYSLASSVGYSFALAGGSCATPGCHGTAQWGGAAMNCLTCHNTALGDRRQVVATGTKADGTGGSSGGDFVRASRHVSNGSTTQIVKHWDCVVCHREGDASTGKTSSLHVASIGAKADVNLRNVDNYATGWAWNRFAISGAAGAPYTMTAAQKTTMRDNLDSFCMGCHDANGASTINVNSSNSGLNVGSSARALTPFNTADTLTGNTTDAAALKTFKTTTYGRVLNVKDQFNSTNQTGSGWASHHNLNQFTKRYATRNTTVFPASIFTGYVTKEGKTLNGSSTVAGESGETVGLHCSDCHLNEVNAHGATNARYMLASGTTDADVAWSGAAGNAALPCARCHNNSTYGTSSTTGRFDHSTDSSRTLSTMTSPMGIICFNCHGGYSSGTQGGLGAIHGTNETYNPGGSSTASKRYRFMSGAVMRFYRPAATGTTAIADSNWSGSSTGNSCYTVSGSDTWASGCAQHSSGVNQGSGTINYTKPLDY